MSLRPLFRRGARREARADVDAGSSPDGGGGPDGVAALDLRWDTIDAARTSEHPGYLDELLSRRIDGVTITGVFTPEESAAVVDALGDVDWTEIFFGGVIGMALGMIWPEEPDRSRYLDETESSRKVIVDAFGFDPHQRLQEVLGPMAGGRDLVPPTEDGRPYNPGQLRLWKTGHRGLPAHVGNEFRRDLKDYAMKHMLTTTAVSDHLSYFVVLQPPDVGGALSVYDVVWEQNDASEDGRVDERDDSSFDDLPCLRLTPDAGDLILFGGGWRWHRVDPLTGERARVTYGGFCAPSLDGSAVHFWA